MIRTARLLAVILSLALPLGALAMWVHETHVESGPVRAVALPERVGPWVAVRDDEFTEDVVTRAGVDTYALRQYEAPGRMPIWVYVGMYAAFRANGGKYHDPAHCYPGSGWEIMDYQPVSLEVAGSSGDRLAAQVMQLEKAGQRQLVHYWFQPAERWPQPRALEELMRVVDAMRGSPQYGFVRLSGPMGLDGDEAAHRDLAEFAAGIAAPVRSAVSLLREPAPQTELFAAVGEAGGSRE